MINRFHNKTVMIVGATGGLGSTFARALAAEGAHLILAGRNAAALQDLAAEFGDRAVTRQIDLAQLAEASEVRAALGDRVEGRRVATLLRHVSAQRSPNRTGKSSLHPAFPPSNPQELAK